MSEREKPGPVVLDAETVRRASLAVRAGVAAASSLIHHDAALVPVDASVGLQVWFGLTAELVELFGGGELGVQVMRQQFEQVLAFIRHNAGQADALERGASAVVMTHPPDCRCPLCEAVTR